MTAADQAAVEDDREREEARGQEQVAHHEGQARAQEGRDNEDASGVA